MLYYIDLFCGAGGVTTGVEQAMIDGRKCAKVIACVNHDPHAIASHLANHPECRHFTEDIRTLNVSPLVEMVQDRREKEPSCKIVLWASCECTNFSRAKGGLPRDPDSRTLPEHLYRYIDAIRPDYIQLENVVEFMGWGNTLDGKPVSQDAGKKYLRWVKNIKERGYDYDFRVLNAADFGAYTSRRRYFGLFARKGLPLVFPEQEYSKKPRKDLFCELKPWKAVKDVLDFSDEGRSIFGREKPLVDATLRRIRAGLEKFIVKDEGSFLVKHFSGDDTSKCISVNGPAGTITCKDHHSLITTEHFLDKQYGTGVPASVDRPCDTVTTVPKEKLITVNRFLDQQYGQSLPASIESPCGAITTNPKQNLVSVSYLQTAGWGWPVSSIEKPSPTIVASQGKSPIYLVNVQNSGILQPDPGDSPTMKELKEYCRSHGITDVKMRMLRTDELLAIMGFPKGYKLLGTSVENKKYIGNAVECGMAKKLCQALASA